MQHLFPQTIKLKVRILDPVLTPNARFPLLGCLSFCSHLSVVCFIYGDDYEMTSLSARERCGDYSVLLCRHPTSSGLSGFAGGVLIDKSIP